MILRKESRNMRLSIECKTLFVSEWDAVMKLTAVGKYYFSSDIRNFKIINPPPTPPPPPPPIQFLRTSACVCRTSENCKSLVLQGECNIEIFLSPVDPDQTAPDHSGFLMFASMTKSSLNGN